MSKSNAAENGLLLLIMNNTDFALIGDAGGLRGSVTAGSLYYSLHTADPGEAGTQATNETSYGSYARVAAARSGAGFTVTANSVSPAATVTFAACTSGTATITHFGVGTASSGAGVLLYSGAIGTNQGAFTALASNDTLTVPGIASLAVNDQVSAYAVEGFALPTGLTTGTLYFVLTVSGSAVTLSATLGGATLNLTADGQGTLFKHTPIAVTTTPAVTPQLTTASSIKED